MRLQVLPNSGSHGVRSMGEYSTGEPAFDGTAELWFESVADKESFFSTNLAYGAIASTLASAALTAVSAASGPNPIPSMAITSTSVMPINPRIAFR